MTQTSRDSLPALTVDTELSNDLMSPTPEDLMQVKTLEARIAQSIEIALNPVMASAPNSLRPAVTHALSQPAKRLRPRVAMLSYIAAGGISFDSVLPIALSVELLHAASLIIDDVIDEANSRRGRPALHIAYGLQSALLTAGFLVNEAQRLVTKNDKFLVLESSSVNVFINALDHIFEAEASALEHGAEVSTDEWIEIARGKTSALFIAAAECGGLCAHAEDSIVQALRLFGMNLGIAFQAIDDVLDIEGDPSRIGKAIGKDGHKSPNLAHYIGTERARSFAHGFAQAALDALGQLPASAARAALTLIAAQTVTRDR